MSEATDRGTVLVVDDDVAIVNFIAQALADEGYRVLTGLNVDALHLAHEQQPDAILLDLMMPEMDGVEVTQRLRDDPVTADIPIIAMSAQDRLRVAGQLIMVDDRLPKPFELDHLYATVARWVGAKDRHHPLTTYKGIQYRERREVVQALLRDVPWPWDALTREEIMAALHTASADGWIAMICEEQDDRFQVCLDNGLWGVAAMATYGLCADSADYYQMMNITVDSSSIVGTMDATRFATFLHKILTPYSVLLDAFGAYLADVDASDVLVSELDDGYLVAFASPYGQRVLTFDAPELARLVTAARNKMPLAYRLSWRSVGRELDRRQASGIVVQEEAGGYAVEYTGRSNQEGRLSDLTRLHDTIIPEQTLPSEAPRSTPRASGLRSRLNQQHGQQG